MRNENNSKYDVPWSEDEFIITLDLYFRTRPRERDAKNVKVQEVARLTGRTPASIVYRIGNYAAIDPFSKVKGFDRGGKTVKEMFDKYSADKKRLLRLANGVRKRFIKAAKIEARSIDYFVSNFEDSFERMDERFEKCEKIRKEFLSRFPKNKLKDVLTLSNYAIGKGDTDNFCYWVERKTRLLGSILGARADKFKIYFDKKSRKYKWVKGYKTVQEAFKRTKSEIINILNAAEVDDFEAIKNNEFFKNSHMFRGKILFLYFPDKFSNVFAEEDIDYFLEKLGIEYSKGERVLEKQMKLLGFKNRNPVMRPWSNLKFGSFLYKEFTPPSRIISKPLSPRQERRKSIKELLSEEGVYVLPNVALTNVIEINLDEISPRRGTSRKGKKPKYKCNYLLESIRNQKLGDRGEEVVLRYEKEMLKKHKRQQLAKKVKRVSLEDDTLGYDVRSFTPQGEVKYIEVKATKLGVDRRMPFYLTDKERQVMEEKREEYFIYRIFSANTRTPKLLRIDYDTLKSQCEMKSKLWEVSIT